LAGLDIRRVCRVLPEELALAFASGTHAKLGAGGCSYRGMPADLVRQVVANEGM